MATVIPFPSQLFDPTYRQRLLAYLQIQITSNHHDIDGPEMTDDARELMIALVKELECSEHQTGGDIYSLIEAFRPKYFEALGSAVDPMWLSLLTR